MSSVLNVDSDMHQDRFVPSLNADHLASPLSTILYLAFQNNS
jgi:hypothetical protein